MKSWLGMGIAFGVLAAFAGACTSTAAKPFPDVATFCAAKAKEECQIAPTCAIDPTGCQTLRLKACNDEAASAIATGTRKYNPDNAQACIDRVHAAFATTRIVSTDLFGDASIADKCARVFEGAADKNKACTSNYDCISGRICAPVQPGVAQLVCADKIAKNLSDFCADPGSTCPTGAFCAQATGGAAQCQARAQLNQACSAAAPCAETLRCSGGTCTPRATPGQSCASNDDCSPTAGYCDPNANNICTVGLTFATGAADCKAFVTNTTPIDAGTPAIDAGTAVDSGGGVDATAD